MKSTRFSKFAGVIASALVLLSAVAFVSCQQEDNSSSESEVSVYGTWVDSYASTYEISKTAFKNYGEGYSSYEGDSVVVKSSSKDGTEGYIYIKYTKAYCTTHSDTANYVYTYDEDAADVGKWYAIHYSELTASSIKLSGAYGSQEGHYLTSTDTLEEAESEFTVSNGYFAFDSACVRSK